VQSVDCDWSRLGSAPSSAIRQPCFLFQAEDGIRCRTVTGVKTCALPISKASGAPGSYKQVQYGTHGYREVTEADVGQAWLTEMRSEERRVGKECRSGGTPTHRRRKRTSMLPSRELRQCSGPSISRHHHYS